MAKILLGFMGVGKRPLVAFLIQSSMIWMN